MFGDQDPSEVIPNALRPYSYFVLDRQYDELYRLLTNQLAVSPEPLGSMRELPVISPGIPDSALPLDAVYEIESHVRAISAGPFASAEIALDDLERMVDYPRGQATAETAIRQLVSYISALDASATYPLEERLLRRSVVRALTRLSDGRLNAFFTGKALSGVDLAMFDFRGADLSGTDFSASFMIECDLRRVSLGGTSFADASIRNARFGGATLDGADFSGTDWFNSLGLEAAQLKTARTETLRPCPASETELLSFLDQRYRFPFNSWGRRVQDELRHAWATYLAPGGLASAVSGW
jgi:Pentapeptide repeats (9 copies)